LTDGKGKRKITTKLATVGKTVAATVAIVYIEAVLR